MALQRLRQNRDRIGFSLFMSDQASSAEQAPGMINPFVSLDEECSKWVETGVLPCLLLRVKRHGRLVHEFCKGYSDLEDRVQVGADTIFAIYSMTKPITAAAMMVLYDNGVWRPDDPIAKHLPEFDGVVWRGDASTAPTIQHLLTHTAGFGYGLPIGPRDAVDDAYIASGVWSSGNLAEFSRRVASAPLAYEPGRLWRYSLAMDLQGALIERVTGQSLSAFFSEKIFQPLNMVDSGFSVLPGDRHRLARVYSGLFGPALTRFEFASFARTGEPSAFASGGGGLYSTVQDYEKFAQMLLRRGATNNGRIISEEAASLMMRNHVPEWMMEQRLGTGPQQMKPGFGRGYNGSVFADPVEAGSKVGTGTYQWDGASSVWFWVDPVADLTFVAMTNRIMEESLPPFQAIAQEFVSEALERAGDAT
jgi:CubicO group peptidase (beta-lactamase class C family)